MVLSIPCGDTAIRVYDRPCRKGLTSKVQYRSEFYERTGKVSKSPRGKRLWGAWTTSIRSTVASLLPRLKLKPEETAAVWANEHIVSEVKPPASSHMSRINGRSPSAVVFFRKHPFEGIVRHYKRKTDGKVRMVLSRTGDKRFASNLCDTIDAAFLDIQEKCIEKGRDVPVMYHKHKGSVDAGAEFIHQIVCFNDGTEDMPELFTQSSSAWKAYATRQHCNYKLWKPHEVDTLIQLKAPDWVHTLYRDVRFPVQRVRVACFFILFMYGGLYADLNTFPNREKFPMVELGLCKKATKPLGEKSLIRRKHEWEIEVVVGTEGNECLMQILKDMSKAMEEKRKISWYKNKPSFFISSTTGKKRVSQTVQSLGYGPEYSRCARQYRIWKSIFRSTTQVEFCATGLGWTSSTSGVRTMRRPISMCTLRHSWPAPALSCSRLCRLTLSPFQAGGAPAR